jgi:hypothetical protein
MPQEKLTIVPVTLLPESRSTATSISPLPDSSGSCCTIKTANVEVSFNNGVEEHVIQTIMRELKHW